MKVFKLYMKIMKKNWPILLLYMSIFTIVSVSISMLNSNKEGNEFKFNQDKVLIAFFDEDNTPLSNSMKKNLERVAEIVEIEDNKEKLQDALFFRNIIGIIRIEKGFSEKFFTNQVVSLEMNTIPNTYASTYVELAANNYLNTARGYLTHTQLAEKEVIENTEKDLAHEINTQLMQEQEQGNKTSFVFFDYMAYSVLAILILGISITMSTINEKNVRRRIQCSPIGYKRMGLELTLGHFVLALMIFTLSIGIISIFMPAIWKTSTIYLFLLNAFIMTLVALSIGFLIGNILKNREAQNAAANVLSLGLAFISGVFVPQEMLNGIVLKIANFSPVYWYVKNNNLILNLVKWDFENLKPILTNMGIMLGFAIAMWLIALVISKNKQVSEN